MPCILAREFEFKLKERLDILEVVYSSHDLYRLFQPFCALYSIFRSLIEWRSPVLCIILLVLINVGCLFLQNAFGVLTVIMFVGTSTAIGLCHRRFGLLVKILPHTSSGPKYVTEEESLDSHQERMQEFRLLIILVHSFLDTVCRWLTQFYAILAWEDLNRSIKFHSALAVTGLLLCALPFQYNLVLAADICLLYCPLCHFIRFLEHQESKQSVLDVLRESQQPEAVPGSEDAESQRTDIQVDTGAGVDSDLSDYEKLPDDLIAKNPCRSVSYEHIPELVSNADAASILLDRILPNQRRTGVVNKILEVKRRRQQSTDKCITCSVVFTTILKRKHICNYCGNHFCSRCCSHKVPRSTFGATAPAAQTETVAVCFNCFNILVGSSSKSKGN